MKTEILLDYVTGSESNALNYASGLIHAPDVTLSDLERAAWYFSEAARYRKEYIEQIKERATTL